MFILSLIGYILIAMLLMSMLARARPWIRSSAPGKLFKTLPVGLWHRIRIHQSTLLALLTGIAFGILVGWLPVNTAGLVAAFAAVILMMPMNYTFTNRGIAVGDAIFRSWDEFSGCIPAGRRLELTHPSYFGRLTLFIRPAEMKSVLEYVERHVGS